MSNKMLTINEVYSIFSKTANNAPLKLNFSDAKSQPYCGCNDFSVNFKKSTYVIYMSQVNSEICKSVDSKLSFVENLSDTTKNKLRCQKLIVNDNQLLKKLINAVVTAKFAT